MPGKIFVNYRRGDTRDMAARIRDRLAQIFGDTNVFMDVDHLVAGQRFDKQLEKALGETDVFLAMIGPRWLELLADRQRSGEHDYAREEIAGALRRGVGVIPVLVEATPLPRATELPEDIRDLVLHQKHVVTYERFGRDVEDLAGAIRLARKVVRGAAGRRGLVARWIVAAAVAVMVLGSAALIISRDAQQRDEAAKAKAAEHARQDEARRTAEAKKKADDEAQEKRAAEEAERARLAALKAAEDRARAEAAAKKRAEEEAQAKREAEKLAMLQAAAEEGRKRAEAEAKRKADEEAAARDQALSAGGVQRIVGEWRDVLVRPRTDRSHDEHPIQRGAESHCDF